VFPLLIPLAEIVQPPIVPLLQVKVVAVILPVIEALSQEKEPSAFK
jgi:hypothetical protein